MEEHLTPDGVVAVSNVSERPGNLCVCCNLRWGDLGAKSSGIVIFSCDSTVLVHSHGSATAGTGWAHGRATRSSLVVYPEPLLFLVRLPLFRAHTMLGSRASTGTSGHTSRDRWHGEGSGWLGQACAATGKASGRSGRWTSRNVLSAVSCVTTTFRGSGLRLGVLRHLGRVLSGGCDTGRVERLDLRSVIGEIDRSVVLRSARIKLGKSASK